MKAVTPDIKFPELEREVLAKWEKDQTFHRSNARRRGNKEFVFCDGPPFANGLPHYGHLLASALKDTVTRYWNLRGFYVDRRFGWDCHGVPVEFEIEKQNNLKGRTDILAMGIDEFNEACRASALHYMGEWQQTITRLGRWVDWDNQYRTMDKKFMESVWWVFAELYRKGLVYKDFKVVPYSPRITAVLSNFEANQNYKDVQDPAITVKFKLTDEQAYLLAWTTTPWTLVSNLGLCVGPEVGYVKIRDHESGEVYYLAQARLDALYKKKGKKNDLPYEILETVSADQLRDRRYEPLFPFFKDHPGAFKVMADDYVTLEDGTGIVHLAPAYGEDDFRVCKAQGIELVDPVDEEGKFTAQIGPYVGQFVKDADKNIIKDLKESGALLRHDVLVHSYPYCERTDEPLIYKAISTWYVAVEKIKTQLMANNQEINWVPDHLRDGRMGKWLANARDWAISRNRFWGTPLPIWICDQDDSHITVIGSVSELEERAGAKIDDLHIHFVDKHTFACSQCQGVMKRIPEVFDCWFESGSMPYAQIHYPFENKEKLDTQFPADFIAEGLDQTRGWFYTLSVLSTALWNRPAFKNVVVNGMVLADDGKKMSKRLKNYTPPEDLLNRFGADSVRLYMLNSPVLKAGDLCFTDQGVRDTTRAVLIPLWNALSFLSTYAQADGWQPSLELRQGKAPDVALELDQWLLSRLQTLAEKVHVEMEAYRLYAVVPPVLDFIEDLTNWYIRLSRKRFWGTDANGKVLATETVQAYETLFHALLKFSQIFAPFAPFLADRIYEQLTGQADESVHLTDMPLMDPTFVNKGLEKRMELVRRTTNLGRSLRAKHQIKTRQVLPSMLVITRHKEDGEAIAMALALIKSELNIKEIGFTTEEAKYVRLSLKPNLKTLGRRLGKEMGAFRLHLEAMNSDHEQIAALLAELDDRGQVVVLGHELTEEDFLIDRGPKDERLIATEKGVTVLLDTRLTDELILEGLSREIVNRVQKLRKDSGLQVTDRIALAVSADGKLKDAVEIHREYIARETLATTISITADSFSRLPFSSQYDIDSMECHIGFAVSEA